MSTKIVTDVVRLSYANVWTPKVPASQPDAKPKYSCSILIPKTDKKTVAAINQAIDEAIKEGIGKFGGKIPNKATLKLPLRDGDVEREDDPAYKGHWFLNASANEEHPPKIVDRRVQPILDHSEVYSGVYAKVALNFFAFAVSGNKGVACGLGNIQKIRDGEPLGSASDPEKEFSAVEDDEDDLGL